MGIIPTCAEISNLKYLPVVTYHAGTQRCTGTSQKQSENHTNKLFLTTTIFHHLHLPLPQNHMRQTVSYWWRVRTRDCGKVHGAFIDRYYIHPPLKSFCSVTKVLFSACRKICLKCFSKIRKLTSQNCRIAFRSIIF